MRDNTAFYTAHPTKDGLVHIPNRMEKEFWKLKERYDVARRFFLLTQRDLTEFLEECEKE